MDELSLVLEDEHQRPPRAHHAERLERCVEDEGSSHVIGPPPRCRMVGRSIEEGIGLRARLRVNVERVEGLCAAPAALRRGLGLLDQVLLRRPKRSDELVSVTEELVQDLIDFPRRLDDPDLVPITKLAADAAREPTSLKRRESFHWHDRCASIEELVEPPGGKRLCCTARAALKARRGSFFFRNFFSHKYSMSKQGSRTQRRRNVTRRARTACATVLRRGRTTSGLIVSSWVTP